MARIRTIKPEFWSDEKVSECSVSARLLFIATWNFADDHGGIGRSAKQLKAQAFPYDQIDCEPLIQELLKLGLLLEYEVDGKRYLHIRNFSHHQLINRPSNPKHPKYVNGTGVLTESSVNAHITEGSLSTPCGMEGSEGRKEGSDPERARAREARRAARKEPDPKEREAAIERRRREAAEICDRILAKSKNGESS